ncbi:hypothetical protein [Geosporobacter ferrireducens]|nr:hypothetical protein [Geosporobacter ferrireducens]
MWNIQSYFFHCNSKKDPNSHVKIVFGKLEYDGWVTVAKNKRTTPAYRLWFSNDLLGRIKDVYLMSYMRNLEARLRNEKPKKIEDEIPFWEFFDIEYDSENKTFYFTVYYTQKPSFPELFKRMVGSPILHKIDDELNNKDTFRIHKQDWKPRSEFEAEIGAYNVIYTLIDTENKLIYVCEAKDMVKKFKQGHPSISHWNYYRYNVLPSEIEKH